MAKRLKDWIPAASRRMTKKRAGIISRGCFMQKHSQQFHNGFWPRKLTTILPQTDATIVYYLSTTAPERFLGGGDVLGLGGGVGPFLTTALTCLTRSGDGLCGGLGVSKIPSHFLGLD